MKTCTYKKDSLFEHQAAEDKVKVLEVQASEGRLEEVDKFAKHVHPFRVDSVLYSVKSALYSNHGFHGISMKVED